MRALLLLLTIFIIPSISSSKTIHVPRNYSTIQQAIDAAAAWDTVLVDSGTYVENIDLLGKAITLKSKHGPHLTFIDGNQTGTVVTFKNYEGPYSVLEGFTITNGSGTNYSGNGICGGGIMCIKYASPTIRNNIVCNNTVQSSGAGIYCEHGSPLIIHNTISFNYGIGGGGGINLSTTSLILRGNIISNNLSNGVGAAIATWRCSAYITDNILINNSCDIGGGGIRLHSSSDTIVNNIFAGNKSLQYGGAIYCEGNSDTMIRNNTIINNNSYTAGGGIYIDDSFPNIINTIIWDNDSPNGKEIYLDNWYGPSALMISSSDVKGGKQKVYIKNGSTLNWGTGMIEVDPLLVDPANGDFHLTYPSPCRDTGDNSIITELSDFEGDPRIAYGTVDMGADEFSPHLYYTGNVTPGGYVKVKFIGIPGTTPVGLCIGSGVLDPPITFMWGDWYLQFPIMGPILLGSIPSPDGVLILPSYIPSSPPAPYALPMQAFIGTELTNLCVLEIE